MIAAGTPAPGFSLSDQDGNTVTLEDLRGQTSVLVFYPHDFSPVCTDQLNIYQEVLDDVRVRGAEIYGVSVDSAFCHKAFQDHIGVTIPLLADFEPKGAVAKSYDVYIDERGHNQRALVLIGPDLVVRWGHQAPSPLEIPGANLIFDALDELRSEAAAS
ncbi:MAG: redoxin domain-containing protein [Thermoleophilaceae bacterium]